MPKIFEVTIPELPIERFNGIQKELDIPYCDQSPSQTLDIFYPETGKPPYPVILHFHGGGFMIGSKRYVALDPMLRALKRGYALVSVEYRRSREAHFPALVLDAKAAVRFIRANSEKYGLDPNAIAAWGPSAGGYIVGMLGVTGGNPAFEDKSMGNGEVSSEIQAAVVWCGPCGNFLEMDACIQKNGIGYPEHNAADSPESFFMGLQITKIPELVRMANPSIYAHENIPPFLIHHGRKDPLVPVQQAEEFAAALMEKAKDKVSLRINPEAGHHDHPWYSDPALTDEVFDFLDKVVKK